MLEQRGVPYETKDEGADENRQHEHEKLIYNIRLVFGLDKIGELFY